jgi:integrase
VVAQHFAAKRRAKTAAVTAAENTFPKLLREFFIDHRTRKWGERPRRWREDARLLGLSWPREADPAKVEPETVEGSLAASWRDRPITAIDEDDIYTAVDEARRSGIPGLKAKTKGTSEARGRKVYSALSIFFTWARRHRKIRIDPTAGAYNPPPAPARDRTLAEDEIRWVWKAAHSVGAPYGPLYKILLLTGARLNEAVGMTRAELNGGGDWEIPSNRTKNHRPHLLPLPPLAHEIIAKVPKIESQFIFTAGGKKLSGFSKAKTALDARVTAVAAEEKGELKSFRIHDLRRTVSTGTAAIGIQPHVIEAVLNHVSGHKSSVAGIYNKYEYHPEKKEALERWAAHVDGIVNKRAASVTPLRGGRK